MIHVHHTGCIVGQSYTILGLASRAPGKAEFEVMDEMPVTREEPETRPTRYVSGQGTMA